MADNILIRTEVEPDVKKAAEDILHRLGMTEGEALQLFYRELVLHDGLPFDTRVPNATTVATFEKSDQGEDIVRCRDIDDLFAKLEI